MTDRSSAASAGTQSLERAIGLLRAVAAAGREGARLSDLISDVALSKGTVHRLLTALTRERFIEQDQRSRRYYLGPELESLGQRAAHGHSGGRSLQPEPLPSAFLRLEYQGEAIALATLLCDRHTGTADGTRIALLHESVAGQTTELSFARLARDSARFASVLARLGVTRGDRVAVLLPKGPELLIAAVAIWRLGGIYMPLYTTYPPEAITCRLNDSNARVIVTNGFLRRKLSSEEGRPLVEVEGDGSFVPNQTSVPFWSALHDAAPIGTVAHYSEGDAFALLYTSEPAPLGVSLLVKALPGIEQFMRIGLDLRDDDIYWNMANPGWAYGIYYGLIGPLLLGRPTIFCDGPHDVRQGYRLLTKFGVTNLTAAPSQIRAWQEGAAKAPSGRLALRIVSVVGEPLPHDLVVWANDTLKVPLLDQYGQREAGVFIVNRYDPEAAGSLTDGSLGRPLPGFRVVVLDQEGEEAPIGRIGEIAIDVEKSPLFWFEGYSNDADRTAYRFRHGRRYYLTGDWAFLDANGSIHYRGRASDAIVMQQDDTN